MTRAVCGNGIGFLKVIDGARLINLICTLRAVDAYDSAANPNGGYARNSNLAGSHAIWSGSL